MVTQNHFRWDFIGLSTDEKPTPATSDKVVDGSTFYCSDNSKLYVFCKTQWYEKTATGGGGTTYTAGTGIDITEDTISADVDAIQAALDTFTGTDGTSAGTAGVVPAPAATDADKFLKSDGTWDTAGGSSITVEQSTGTSQTSVMSQQAVSQMIFPAGEETSKTKIAIGKASSASSSGIAIGGFYTSFPTQATADNAIAIGSWTRVSSANDAIAMGNSAQISGGEGALALGRGTLVSSKKGAVALGAYASPASDGEVNIGSTSTSYGYNSSNYRLLSGVYDGQSAHDAATKGQLDNAIINGGTTAPTTSTVGSVGTLYSCVESGTPHLYSCTAVSGSTYTWSQLV